MNNKCLVTTYPVELNRDDNRLGYGYLKIKNTGTVNQGMRVNAIVSKVSGNGYTDSDCTIPFVSFETADSSNRIWVKPNETVKFKFQKYNTFSYIQSGAFWEIEGAETLELFYFAYNALNIRLGLSNVELDGSVEQLVESYLNCGRNGGTSILYGGTKTRFHDEVGYYNTVFKISFSSPNATISIDDVTKATYNGSVWSYI